MDRAASDWQERVKDGIKMNFYLFQVKIISA